MPESNKKILWNKLVKGKLYTKSYPEFENQFADVDNRTKLHTGLVKNKLYTKGIDEFNSQFFSESVKKKDEISATGGKASVSETPSIEEKPDVPPKKVEEMGYIWSVPEVREKLETPSYTAGVTGETETVEEKEKAEKKRIDKETEKARARTRIYLEKAYNKVKESPYETPEAYIRSEKDNMKAFFLNSDERKEYEVAESISKLENKIQNPDLEISTYKKDLSPEDYELLKKDTIERYEEQLKELRKKRSQYISERGEDSLFFKKQQDVEKLEDKAKTKGMTLEEYFLALHTEWEELGNKMGVGKTPTGIAALNPIENFTQAIKDFDMMFGYSEDAERLKTITSELQILTPIVLINKNPLKEDSFFNILGSSFIEGMFGENVLIKSEQKKAQQILNAIDIVPDKDLTDSARSILEDTAKPYEPFSSESVAQLIGTTGSIIIPVMAGTGVVSGTSSLMKGTKLGKIFLNSAKANNLTGKMLNFGARVTKTGLSFEVGGILVPATEDELNFASGAAGEAAVSLLFGISNKYINPLLRTVFGNKSSNAASILMKIKNKAAGLHRRGVAETFEETAQTLMQTYQESDNFKDTIESLKSHFGEVDNALFFVVSSYTMGAGMGGGGSLGESVKQQTLDAYNKLTPEQKEKFNQYKEHLTGNIDKEAKDSMSTVKIELEKIVDDVPEESKQIIKDAIKNLDKNIKNTLPDDAGEVEISEEIGKPKEEIIKKSLKEEVVEKKPEEKIVKEPKKEVVEKEVIKEPEIKEEVKPKFNEKQLEVIKQIAEHKEAGLTDTKIKKTMGKYFPKTEEFKQEAFREAEKLIETKTPEKKEVLKERAEQVKKDLGGATEDIMASLGLIQRAEGTTRPELFDAVKRAGKHIYELGEVKIEQLVEAIKTHLATIPEKERKELFDLIDKNQNEIIDYVKKEEAKTKREDIKKVKAEDLSEPPRVFEKTEIAKELAKLEGMYKGVKMEKRKQRIEQDKKIKKVQEFIKFIKTSKPEGLGKANINRIIERVRDVLSGKKDLDVAINEIKEVFKDRVKRNIISDIDKQLKSKTITEEGKNTITEIKKALSLDKETSSIEKDKIQIEIDGLKDSLHDVIDESKISEIEKNIEDKEFQLKIFDEFSDIDSKSLADIEILSDINKEGIKKYRDDFKKLREAEKDRLNEMNDEAADIMYGTEEIKEKLAGRKDVARDTEKEGKKRKSIKKVFLAAFETLPNLFHMLDKSFRKGADIKHGDTIFGKWMDDIARGLSKAIGLKTAMEFELQAKIKELFKNERKFRKILDKKITVTITPPTKGAELRKIKIGTLAHIWASWNSPANKKSVEKIGITEEVIKDIEKIPEFEKIKEYSEWLMDDFLPKYYNEANKIFKKKTGKNLSQLERYLPLNAKSWKVKGEMMDVAIVDIFKSFTKERLGGRYDLTKNDVFDTATKYINDYSNFIGLAETISDIQSVFKSRIVQNAIERTGNSPYVEAIFETLNAGYNGRTMPKTMAGKFLENKILNFVRRRFIQTKILNNISLFPKQTVSFVTAFDGEYGNPIGIAEEMATLPLSKAKKIVWEIFKQSPQFKVRSIVSIESLAKGKEKIRPDMFGKTKADIAMGTALTFLWNPTQIGDRFTIALGGLPIISYNYKLELKKLKQDNIIGEEAKKIASEKALLIFEKFMNETQQSRMFPYLSSLQRGGWKNATVFMNSVMSYTRKLFKHNREIARGYGNKKVKLKRENPNISDIKLSIKSLSGIKGKNVLGAFIYGSLLPTLWTTAITGGANFARLWSDDEEEVKDAWIQLGFDATLGWTKGFFGVGFLLDYIQHEVRGKRYGESADNVIKVFDDVFEFAKDVVKVGKYLVKKSKNELRYDEEIKLYNALFDTSNKALSYALGLPEEEIKKIKQALFDDDYKTATEKILRIYGMPKDDIKFWAEYNQDLRDWNELSPEEQRKKKKELEEERKKRVKRIKEFKQKNK